MIRKAVIVTAGKGTRFLPITKAISKEMLPILNRPVIDYLVDDCLRVGVKEIIMVVREGNSALRSYYQGAKFKITFVEQKETDGYGTSVPLKLIRDLVAGQSFLYMTGDDICYLPNQSCLQGLVESAERLKVSAMTGKRVSMKNLKSYGVLETVSRDGNLFVKKILEKPVRKESSNLINISKYIFQPDIFENLNLSINKKLGEYLLTDVLTVKARQGELAVHVTKGKYLDCGCVDGWLAANNFFAKL